MTVSSTAARTIEGTTRIDRPPEEVFDFLADSRNEPSYNPVVVTAEKVTPGPVGPGTRFVEQARSLGRIGEVAIEVMVYERPRHLVWHIESGETVVDGDIRLSPGRQDGASTLVEWGWHVRPRSGPMRADPVVGLLGGHLEGGMWRRLKALLESREQKS